MILASSSAGGLNGANGNNNSSINSINEKDKMWYFTAEQLANSPSRRSGIKPDQELSYRQLTAYLIQEMGQRLQVSQLCINTAIVYMHRFYAFHSFSQFHRNSIAAASLFLAAKVEEQPRKLEHVIKAANKCLPQAAETNYSEQAQDLVFNENILLQTLGFDVAIDHPHTHVVKTCHLVKACKDLAQTSYFLASNSLHLTSMCLQYRPTVVACFCIYLACKWSRWEIPQSTEGKHWFYYVDKSVTLDLLKKLTDEFIGIYEKSPTRLQSKLNSIKAIAQGASNRGKDKAREDFKMGDIMKGYHSSINTDSNSNGAYSTSDNNMGQQTSSSSSALLPPPSQLPPQQQMRKVPDMHSSQHRSSSASSASHHHNKPTYSNAGDVNSDHKAKQQSGGGYVSNAVNRPPSSSHQSMSSSSNAQRSGLSSSSGRSSSSSVSLSSQRPAPPQMHPMDYHKSSSSSRDRNGMNLMPGAHGVLPPHGAHKMPPKLQQDVNRSSAKDIIGRMPEPPPPKQSSSKLYPGGPPPYGSSSNQLPQSQSNKMDDPTRSLMHNQRSFMTGSNSNSSSSSNVGQPSNSGSSYHHHHQRPPNSLATSGSSSTISNSKSSVHGLPHTQYDQLPPPYGSQTTHQQGYTNSMRSASDAMQTQSLNDEHSLMPPIQVAGASAAASLFSPDLKDKQQQQPHLNGLSAHIQQHESLSFKPLTGNNRDKNSPKRERSTTSSTSSSATPTKRDKNRIFTSTSSSSSSSITSTATNLNALAGMRHDQTIPVTQARMGMSLVRKPDISVPSALTTFNELSSVGVGAGASHQSGISGLKRLNDGSSYAKHDEDLLLRENKIRKVDNSSLSSGQSTVGGGLSSFAFPGSTDTTTHDKLPISMVNGMETTPDLVRSLIKEVCTSNALMKSEPLTMPGLKPPAELLDPSSGQSTLTSSASSTFIKTFGGTATTNANELMSATASSAADAQFSEQNDDKLDTSKSEKKKKKDKHKHKEKDKDKSKDREERKKHKKDKEKHKDRDRDNDSLEHVKLVIPKDKLESGGGDLKIKIAKDRFKADVGNTSSGSGSSSSSSTTISTPQLGTTTSTSGLKIKISKDILESYNSSSGSAGGGNNNSSAYSNLQQQQSSLMGQQQQHHVIVGAANLSAIMNPYGGMSMPMAMANNVSGGLNVGSVSNTNLGKRKDRDRDRDKKRSNNVQDFLKYNGSANLMAANVGGVGNFPMSAATSSAASLMHLTSSASLVTTANNAAVSLSSAYGKK